MSKNVQTAPSKLHFSVNKRLSEERVKRIHSARRAPKENRRKSKRHELGVEIVEDESYNDFQENIGWMSKHDVHDRKISFSCSVTGDTVHIDRPKEINAWYNGLKESQCQIEINRVQS